ncbi:MAG TPA: lipopolysaccharide assembly protein LapA domain-containing protein [Solirubrobacteraceae bacterium]|nr:lipopolysaccharide assembly protein LapA domain-containing protein [Solirubrobacteraceae bacterium]
MSEQAQGSQERKRSRREQARTAGMVVLAILVTLFAVLNLEAVKVNWIFGTGEAPLIIVIVISVLVGIVLTYLAGRRASKRR